MAKNTTKFIPKRNAFAAAVRTNQLFRNRVVPNKLFAYTRKSKHKGSDI